MCVCVCARRTISNSLFIILKLCFDFSSSFLSFGFRKDIFSSERLTQLLSFSKKQTKEINIKQMVFLYEEEKRELRLPRISQDNQWPTKPMDAIFISTETKNPTNIRLIISQLH